MEVESQSLKINTKLITCFKKQMCISESYLKLACPYHYMENLMATAFGHAAGAYQGVSTMIFVQFIFLKTGPLRSQWILKDVKNGRMAEIGKEIVSNMGCIASIHWNLCKQTR